MNISVTHCSSQSSRLFENCNKDVNWHQTTTPPFDPCYGVSSQAASQMILMLYWARIKFSSGLALSYNADLSSGLSALWDRALLTALQTEREPSTCCQGSSRAKCLVGEIEAYWVNSTFYKAAKKLRAHEVTNTEETNQWHHSFISILLFRTRAWKRNYSRDTNCVMPMPKR